jgi:hypothetical protein
MTLSGDGPKQTCSRSLTMSVTRGEADIPAAKADVWK